MPIGSQNFVYKFIGVDAYSVVAGKVARASEKVQSKAEAAARSAAVMAAKWQSAGNKMRGVGANLSVFSAALGGLGLMAISKSADMEMISKSFSVFIEDAGQAKTVLADLIEFSKRTPFLFQDVANLGKNLIAVGLPVEETMRTVKMLGEVASASNKPLTEVGLLWGKILSQGRITGEEVLSFATKGVAITKMLIDRTGLTGFEIKKKIEEGALTFKMVDQLVSSLTTGTGRLAGLTEELSTTLTGMWSTFRGNMDLALISMGNTLVQTFGLKQGMLDLNLVVEDLAVNFEKFAAENKTLTKVGLFGALGLVALGPIVLLLGQMTLAVGGLISLWGSLGVATAWIAETVLSVGALAQNLAALGVGAGATVAMGTLLSIFALILPLIAAIVIKWDILMVHAENFKLMFLDHMQPVFDFLDRLANIEIKAKPGSFLDKFLAMNTAINDFSVADWVRDLNPQDMFFDKPSWRLSDEELAKMRAELQMEIRVRADPGTSVEAIQSTTRETSSFGINLAHGLS